MMTEEQFKQFLQDFNDATDKGPYFDKYFAPDVVFTHPFKGTFHGKDELVSFWNSGKHSGHAGIHEILHLENFLPSGDKLAVQLKIEWRCFEDTDYFGPRKAGDVFWGNDADFDEFTDGKISRLRIYLNLVEDASGPDQAAS